MPGATFAGDVLLSHGKPSWPHPHYHRRYRAKLATANAVRALLLSKVQLAILAIAERLKAKKPDFFESGFL
ncbi:hypothetical protein, partial [Pseudoalteromonas phenolica]|uniref:hypothetical protein n=1 Tax=Pseudoalteromonas phenolica TaxID=161398 RepID=UPI001271C0F5